MSSPTSTLVHLPATSDPATLTRRGLLAGATRLGIGSVALRATTVAGLTTGATTWSSAAAAAASPGTGPGAHGPEVLDDWFATLYSGLMDEPGMTPGRAARLYAVAAVAAHEALVPGTRHLKSLAGQLKKLGKTPGEPSQAIDWPLAVATAIATAAGDALRNGTPALLQAITSQLATHDEARRRAGVPRQVLERSRKHGAAVGKHVAAWARKDGAEATYDRAYTPPVGPALWRSTPPNNGTAIDPWWGTVRPMGLPSADFCSPGAPPIAFSTDPGSGFRREVDAVLAASDALTDAGRATALYWRDNPTTSGLPAGHWVRLAVQVCRERGLALDATSEVLVLTAVALSDAFVSCWEAKYTTNLLRPISYVREHVPGRSDWLSHVNTPQFPEFTSGHSVASQAAATVLTDRLGKVTFTDRTHALRNPQLGSRSYRSFQKAADEAANSRLLGGIHYPMGISVGLQQGVRVGRTVLTRVSTRT